MSIQSFIYSILIYILIDRIVILEDIFYKTGSINPAGGAGKWPLMTRAHLAQAVVSVALADKEDGTTVIIFSLLNLQYFLYSLIYYWLLLLNMHDCIIGC